jgi:hypothetical protein
MTAPPLSIERFRALVAAYGGRLEVWPEHEAASAREFVAASAEARALLAAEAELDRLLAAESVPPEVPARLLRRLNEVPIRAPQKRVLWPFGRAWVPALGWAFAGALGIGWGLFSPPFEASELETTPAVMSASGSAREATAAEPDDDISALAGGTLVEFEE